MSEAAIAESALDAPEAEACLTGVMGALRFPAPRDGGDATITYPVYFDPQ